nr:MAG TPA: Ribosome biosynthesis protein [Caudoviricetes sp.]
MVRSSKDCYFSRRKGLNLQHCETDRPLNQRMSGFSMRTIL